VAQNTDLLFSTSDWVEICRTTDEWEAKLIQAALGSQQMRCRPDYKRDSERQRQIILFVAPEDQIEALEIVSRTGLAVTNNEYENQRGHEASNSHAERNQDFELEDKLPKATPTAVKEITIAEREGIGKIVHHVEQGYELQVGAEPYYMVEEGCWEEFTDFSAQRQEFSILIRHEYPTLFRWLKQGKLMAEFIRLVESTYREVRPPRRRNRKQSTSASANDPDSTGATDALISNLAKFSLWVSLVSLVGVILHLPWYASLTLALLAAATGFVAKYRIDISNGTLNGSLIALLAIIIACIVIAITWTQHQSSQRELLNLRSAHLSPPTSSGVDADPELDPTFL
jgi:hypothetical protein